MTSVTAHDYAWIRSSPLFRHALETGYTLTLVRGVTPVDVLRVMEAEPQGTCTGADALIERQEELLDATDYWDESFISGAFTVPGVGGDWTLVLHFDGGVGMRPRFLEALSAGGRAVVHSSNGGKPIHLFHWYEDGELRTTFEWPTARDGSTPDALNSVMREVGFDLSDDEGDTGARVDTKAVVLALAERLTGVRVTEELLRDAEYHLGHLPEEPAEEWTGIVIDITDAHGERLYKEVTREEVEAAVARARAESAEPIVILGPSSPAP
ncbi:hypothetical protein SLUN_35020 [Streptomyces lunaelactis]|uniref:Uncharacterized protein n=1 Tax=Streptomyces lunaelactis TaxID=1535768 RepID=A0A2R4TC38_9ACTN|nr:DUF6461 domain-containing protein [Streptomyces lunaelactis]AVZ76651.1 hypothetical protein SLUN_35020 [Streptomyces lunaelactis]NUK83172.1 hypothetical protein [Streptomyces lunaelactis]